MAIKVNHKRLNWIEIAESLSNTYSQRLDIELNKIPEYDEIDFIQNELLQADAELNEPFTNESSVIWKRYKKIIENYKYFLEERKENIQTSKPKDEKKTRIKHTIEDAFESMDVKGWKYAFINEKDYNLFTDLLTYFFENKPYTLPEKTVLLKRTCKTKIAKALGGIHRELSKADTLTNDTEYFEIIKVLTPFKNKNHYDLYKALTR